MKGLTSAAALLTLAASLIASPAAAQMTGAPTPGYLQAPGAPAQSMLYSEVHSGVMPKAPYGPLPDNEVTLILNWIKGGGKNN